MCSDHIYPVFVYGSLLHGLHNHHYLDAATFVCDGYVHGRLWDLGHYPALDISYEAGLVAGEVYEINDETRRDLDSLEGYNPRTRTGCYLRRTHTVITLAGSRILADVYAGNMDLSRLELIETGRITDYRIWQQRKDCGERA